MILAPTFAIMFILSDKLELNSTTCRPTATMGIPSWDLRKDMHGTAWHSVWHIKNILQIDLDVQLQKELAKPALQQDKAIINQLQQGIKGWAEIIKTYEALNELSKTQDEALPGYTPGQQDLNALVQASIEGAWHDTLDKSPERNAEAYEGRLPSGEWLENTPVWRQGYFEGPEKLQSLMLKTQGYMDASSAKQTNLAANPGTVATAGGVVAGKQLDALGSAYDLDFSTFQFSGGGSTYSYSFTTSSTLSTTIQFSISTENFYGTHGSNEATFPLFHASVEKENTYGFELEFSSERLQETARTRTVSVTFGDQNLGDQFLVKVKPDPAFGTPFFETLGGRSKCPPEPNTLNREKARLFVLGGQNTRVS
ncbi:hypothetical protein HYH03_013527 [Edaphochlamys debaryana]|uniref:Cadherin domain-containing protein n=1 Tax=Edaphochlamys debaryana TaxID=47281 RepID=A0A836BUG3_9CHLO|nr:hypothetical protein HYH03_013527 [Edaphochlamys debaryana]|eukprot:KAG2487948.1 hypothetical protein HYH03_013527 [Edaphochlamys debaryana]